MAEGDVSLLVTRLTSYGSCPYRRCSMSFASLLRADRRENGRVEHDEWHAVDAARIEEVISRMDQRRHTETALEGRDWWLALIGGGSGAYIVSIENRMTVSDLNWLTPGNLRTKLSKSWRAGNEATYLRGTWWDVRPQYVLPATSQRRVSPTRASIG